MKTELPDCYLVWMGIKSRCYNKNTPHYSDYGGRGIIMCSRWVNSFENFISDMGPRPSVKYTIDRINNNDGYNPTNCRWATKKEQARNRRSNILVTIEGKTLTLMEWSEKFNIPYQVLITRYRSGIMPSLELSKEITSKERTANNKKTFLFEFKKSRNRSSASRKVGVNRKLHESWIRKDSQFRDAFNTIILDLK